MFDQNGKLKIFENFVVDRALPKFIRVAKKFEGIFTSGLEEGPEGDSSDEEGRGSESIVTTTVYRRDGVRIVRRVSGRWYERWWARIRGKKTRSPEISVEEFFHSVKDSVEQVGLVDERARGYAKAIERAHEAGQVALEEQLVKNLAAVRAEVQLLAIGLGKYLDEEVVVTFAKKASKAVRLDWVKNFTRMIPGELLTAKREADERGIFDNYVVMHYDPKGKSWSETQAEKDKRRDPILFGVVDGRRRLYYVGDWVDELCDLTLDQVADVLGRKGAVGDVGGEGEAPQESVANPAP